MEKRLKVYIGDYPVPVADVIYAKEGSRQYSRFEYTSEWLDNPAAFPISPEVPIQAGPEFRSNDREKQTSSFLSAIADCCPDSWGRGLIRRKIPGATDYDYLAEVNDFTRQGALRFKEPGDDRFVSCQSPEIPSISTLEALRQEVHKIELDPAYAEGGAKALFGSGLGGARPKSDAIEDDALYVAKFPSLNDTKPVEKAEVATLWLARKIGLDVPDSFLIGDRFAIAVLKRFDRDDSGKRHLYISGQTMLKSETAIGHYYTDLVDQMRSQSKDFSRDASELFRRVAYTILISNTDDHMKNHGFLRKSGSNGWELSPMFDVNPQPERGRTLETGISPLSADEASIEALIEASSLFDVDENEAVEWIGDMAEKMKEYWGAMLEKVNLSGAEKRFYLRAIEHAEFERALRLNSPQSAPRF
ncbi:type II toxin-antitoxin system HipA family toxin [Kordiimonas lacus]|uniref:Serine/threonine-protein kinase HipA n=1 Tax=Kordiimonas lacus TaxID=637679 RepID=A0A1G6T8I7_9PROT|nr:type II toxin-antitoxin system HipA family toxin [Kordiimonas lacus]SDD25430.1 serine/threonine-protein kinase HipA [Kordiimonas lacus]